MAVYKQLTKTASKESAPRFENRQRVLLLTSRGVTERHRHFVADLAAMLPHARKEPKFDKKNDPRLLNEVADMYNCNNILYFEARKHQDLYMWLSKAPNGPTIKFHVKNLHTMDELNFTGNALRGSRPILSFAAEFDAEPQLLLMKEMFLQIFGVPPRARRSKPFIDHVLSFTVVDGAVWIRNYQIVEKEEEDEMELVEIGPRCTLCPILVLEGSFQGAKIYENKEYVSPNMVRAQQRIALAEAARKRHEEKAVREIKRGDRKLPENPLANSALFK